LLLAFPVVVSACKSKGLGSPDAALQTPDAALQTPDAPIQAPDADTGLATTPPGGVGQVTEFYISAAAQRDFDILFLVDNSPSMGPIQQALADNLPRMIEQLDSLSDGRPNLHIGVVSSDMGAGSQGIGGNCNTVLGDRGLLWGNDPTPGVRATVAPGSQWAIAAGITDGCGLNSGARWVEDIQTPNGGVGRQVNYSGGPTALSSVFACLARGVGVAGCGYAHQLQALRVALNPQKIGCDAQGDNCTDVNMANVGFLREKAQLLIILVTGQDDCSATPNNVNNDNLFMNDPKDPNTNAGTETATLRCAARGHLCNGQPIPDYVDPTRGYTGSGFTANFADCAPKDQNLPSDNGLLPLIAVQDMIDSVNVVKSRPKEQILVSGIIGWLPDSNDLGLPSDLVVSNQYQIGKDATSINGQQNLWDYMPICEIPSQKSADGNIYKAYGGLRLKQFLDAFRRTDPVIGVPIVNTFSICKLDFTDAMTQIGDTMTIPLQPGCVPYPLIDADPSTPGTQPTCQALERMPCDSTAAGGCPDSGYNETPLPECKDSQGMPLDPNLLDPVPTNGVARTSQQITAVLDTISEDQRPCWYLSYDHSVTGCPQAPNGQTISVLRKTGAVAPTGTIVEGKCLTCPDSDPTCATTRQ
jgi:hypothetical protein